MIDRQKYSFPVLVCLIVALENQITELDLKGVVRYTLCAKRQSSMAAAKTVAMEPRHFKAISRNSHLLSVHRSLISKFRSFLFSLFFFDIRSYFILWSLRNKLVVNPHVLSPLLTLPPKKNKGGGKVVEIGHKTPFF